MVSPWQLDADELLPLRGGGGQRFTAFMNALLRAEVAGAGGTPIDADTNIRVNIGDGGVDAEVKVPLRGCLDIQTPSCWQFKATDFPSVTAAAFREEANKPGARRLIEAGHTYLVCVCDDWPPVRVREREEALVAVVREINAAAPKPRLLSAGHMADWASRFPAILIGFFRPHLDGALSFEAWARRERAELPRYVDIPSRAEASRMVTDHVNAVSPSTAVLSLTGPSGAGVSRLVAEALTSAGARVVYTPSDGAALRLATSFVNQADAAAVLVVDHCSLDGRFKLEQMLLAEGHRIRAVLLCDPTQGAVRSSIALRRLGDQDVQRVIDANFPDTPSSHRRAFVHLADGILKIAVRLASAYGTAPSGFLADSSAWAFDELRRLVPDQQDMRVLQALSLFARVGFRGDVSSQMVTVCGLLGLESTEVLHRCPRLSRTPGVVSLGPRYLSVRPRLFAQSLFERAWDEHVAADVPAFIEALPPALEESLLTQAGAMAPKAPRESLANWATPTIRALAPADLGDAVRVQLNRFAFRWSHLKRATWPATRAGSVRKPSKVSTSAPSLSATVA